MIGEPQVNAGLVELMAARWQPLHPLIHFVLAQAHTARLLVSAQQQYEGINAFLLRSPLSPLNLICKPKAWVKQTCRIW